MWSLCHTCSLYLHRPSHDGVVPWKGANERVISRGWRGEADRVLLPSTQHLGLCQDVLFTSTRNIACFWGNGGLLGEFEISIKRETGLDWV